MKKYLILTLVLSAALLIFGLVAVNVPSAHAITTTLPDTGVVGDNMLLDSYFIDLPSYSFSSNVSSIPSIPSWGYSTSGGTGNSLVTGSSGLIISRAASGWSNLRYVHNFVDVQNVTLSFFLSALTGDVTVNIRSSSNVDYYHHFTSLGLNSLTLSYDFSLIQIYNSSQGSFTLSWFKLETGSYFTGFVSNDYSNYGYDQGTTDGIAAGKNTVYQTNKGWSKYDVFRDFKNDDTYLSSITSENGGTVSYVSSRGMKLTSTVNGTSFLISTGSQSISSSNDTLTIALGYIGSFTKGDVVLSFDYSYYTGTSSQPPWSGIDPVSTSFSYSLDPGEIFITSLYPIRDVPAFLTLTIRSGTDFTLQAYKCESGSIFTMFPTGSSDEASFNNGYSSGLTAGIEQGYNNGYSAGSAFGYDEGSSVGYAQGFSDGRIEGYSLGLQTAENGTFFALFSALVDVPVSVSISLLDYDFFGINMWNFARFLLTCVLFLAVLHLFTKGKLKA